MRSIKSRLDYNEEDIVVRLLFPNLEGFFIAHNRGLEIQNRFANYIEYYENIYPYFYSFVKSFSHNQFCFDAVQWIHGIILTILIFNPLVPNAPFLYLLKTSEDLIFCFYKQVDIQGKKNLSLTLLFGSLWSSMPEHA